MTTSGGGVIHAVMFDMDGTLLDSRHYWFNVVKDASRTFGGREIVWDEFLSTFGQSSADDAAQFFPSAAVAEVDAFYNAALPAHGHHIVVMEGALEVLRALRDRRIPTACVTNSPRRFTLEVLALVGMRGLLDAIACADDVPRPKPAPDMLLRAARELGVSTEACMFVGDSRYDVMAARAAGMRMVGLHVDGDARVATLREVLALLGA